MPAESFVIRPAEPGDVPRLLALVRELAEYERAPDAVEATEQHLRQALFPADELARSHALVVEAGGEVVGMAVWFATFSTWTGRNGIWLEDLYVRPEHRGAGLGAALLARLASVAVERGWRRLEWAVLDWNEPSIRFYQALGAWPMNEWVQYRLDGDQLAALAARSAST